MITAIAVDDEPVGLDILSKHAADTGLIDLKAIFTSASEALQYLEQQPVQLVFIDINMPDMSGLEFAEKLRHRSLVIFTTAHAEFALQGFELAATDYLLKPITYPRFLQASELALQRAAGPVTDMLPETRSLFVKDGYNWVRIEIKNIMYAKAEDNYVSIVEAGKYTLTRMTLGNLLAKLPADKFLQVHKSYIVSLTQIGKVEKNNIVLAGDKIPVSAAYRNRLLEAIQDK